MIAQEVYMNRKKDWWQLGISNIRNQKYHKNTAEESMKSDQWVEQIPRDSYRSKCFVEK